MRRALLGFAPALLACAIVGAQQIAEPIAAQGAAPISSEQQQLVVPLLPAPGRQSARNAEDAITRGEAKDAERARKDKARSDAKAQKQAEKDRKSAAEDAKFLKLQDNEIVAASFDEQGNPVKLPPCSRKDKVCQQKRKELLKQKKIGLRVQNGTLTVDGWTGKARLNYDVKNFQYLYVSVPGYGTVVASPDRFPASTELKEALDGKTLTIHTADDHMVQLASDVALSGKGKRPIFFSVDASYRQPGSFPSVGYGFVNKAPYAWPGTLPLTDEQKRYIAMVPALPKGMEARAMTLPCQPVAAGTSPKPIKVNGVLVTPPVCQSGEIAQNSGAFRAGERPPDGSGAASTGITENHSR